MSKEVDALVIIGEAYQVRNRLLVENALPGYLRGLWHFQKGNTVWPNSDPITNKEKGNLRAGAVFSRLGELVTNHLLGSDLSEDRRPNTHKRKVFETIDHISPFADGQTLQTELPLVVGGVDIRGSNVPLVLPNALSFRVVLTSQQQKELEKKWDMVQAIDDSPGAEGAPPPPLETHGIQILEGALMHLQAVGDVLRTTKPE